MDDPMPVTRGVQLPLSEIVVRASRSSGPGGQHPSELEQYVEAPDVDVGVAYDSAGRLLQLRVDNNRVVVEDWEPVPTHQDQLATALSQALRAIGTDTPADASLNDLVRMALAALR